MAKSEALAGVGYCPTQAIKLERTENWALIKQIAIHPDVYPYITDDESPRPEYFQPPQVFTYCLVTEGDEVLGMWIFRKVQAAVYEVHTCILPAGRGKKAYRALQLLADWAWKNLQGARRIITEVPVYNRAALVFALRAGMERYGMNPQSHLKDGQLHDVILLGISRGETCQ